MAQEFVTIRPDGKEVDWIRPVEDVRSTRCYYFVTSDGDEHKVYRREGYGYMVREYAEKPPSLLPACCQATDVKARIDELGKVFPGNRSIWWSENESVSAKHLWERIAELKEML